MSLTSELTTLNEEIKAKQASWLALSANANDDKLTLTPEEKDTLTASNKNLAELIDKKVALENQVTSQAALKAKVDGMTAAEQEALPKRPAPARQRTKAGRSWTVGATKALISTPFLTKNEPHRVDKGLKALFVEGAFTAGTAAGVPGYYEPGNDQGYPPELRREPSLFVPAAVRPVQFWIPSSKYRRIGQPTSTWRRRLMPTALPRSRRRGESTSRIQDTTTTRLVTPSPTLGVTTRSRGTCLKMSR